MHYLDGRIAPSTFGPFGSSCENLRFRVLMQLNFRKVIQPAHWDRGRPARTEREARKGILSKQLRACRRGAGGTPAIPVLGRR